VGACAKATQDSHTQKSVKMTGLRINLLNLNVRSWQTRWVVLSAHHLTKTVPKRGFGLKNQVVIYKNVGYLSNRSVRTSLFTD
jgi:hypothetical protein